MTLVKSICPPYWTRRDDNWFLVYRRRSIARLERAGAGWFCTAYDADGTPWFVGVSGRLANGKAALEKLCLRKGGYRASRSQYAMLYGEAPV